MSDQTDTKPEGGRMYREVYPIDGVTINGVSMEEWNKMTNKQRDAVRNKDDGKPRITKTILGRIPKKKK